MKVLQLGPYPPPHGGIQTNIVAIRRYLQQCGHECDVINIVRSNRTDADGVYYPRSALRLIWLLLRLRYDVLHLHLGGSLTPRLLALCLVCCWLPRKPAVLTFHSGGYPTSPDGQRAHPRSLTGFVFRQFDRLIGVNPAIVDLFHRLGAAPSRTALVLPHAGVGSALAAEVTIPEPLNAFAARHDPLLVTVGLLEPEYDLGLQIEALGKIRRTLPDAGLMILGSGSLEPELKDLIARADYRDHVFLCGDVEHAVTLQLIARASALLRTTWYDGDSIAIREALALGTPVIATDNSMRPPGVTLIPPRDPQALEIALRQAVELPRSQHFLHRGVENLTTLKATLEQYARARS